MLSQLNAQVIRKLEGVWEGNGKGNYPPRVPEFSYAETLSINPTSKPSVWEYRSSTVHALSGKPMHIESGFIRTSPNGSVELIATHPFGLIELSIGECLNENSVELLASDKTLHRVQSATEPFTVALKRRYEISSDGLGLSFSMEMATSNHPEFQSHLVCNLIKTTIV
jgi:hypothetical protein